MLSNLAPLGLISSSWIEARSDKLKSTPRLPCSKSNSKSPIRLINHVVFVTQSHMTLMHPVAASSKRPLSCSTMMSSSISESELVKISRAVCTRSRIRWYMAARTDSSVSWKNSSERDAKRRETSDRNDDADDRPHSSTLASTCCDRYYTDRMRFEITGHDELEADVSGGMSCIEERDQAVLTRPTPIRRGIRPSRRVGLDDERLTLAEQQGPNFSGIDGLV